MRNTKTIEICCIVIFNITNNQCVPVLEFSSTCIACSPSLLFFDKLSLGQTSLNLGSF